MKNLFLLSLMASLLSACGVINCTDGTGELVSKTYSQGNFEELSLAISADVELIQSTKNEVVIETNVNLFEKLVLENNGDELTIDVDGCVNAPKGIKIKVYFTSLSEVSLLGSGNIVANELIKSNNFKVSIQGSGDVKLPISCNKLEAEILGSGDINLSGKVQELAIEINGSGNVNAKALKALKTKVDINGSGDAHLGSCANLNSSVNGSGDVTCQ